MERPPERNRATYIKASSSATTTKDSIATPSASQTTSSETYSDATDTTLFSYNPQPAYPITYSTPTPSTSTQPTPPIAIYNSPSTIPIPKTTEYYQQKRRAESQEAGENKRKYNRKTCFNICSHCKLPKTKDFGHSRHIGEHGVDTFCPAVEGKEYANKDAWMQARKTANPPKKKKKIKNTFVASPCVAAGKYCTCTCLVFPFYFQTYRAGTFHLPFESLSG